MRRLFVVSAIVLAIYIAVEEFQDYVTLNKKTASAQTALEKNSQLAVPTIQLPVRTITSTKSEKSPIEVADAYLKEHRELWKVQAFHELRPVEFRTPLGTKVKYSVFQNNIPIVDMGIEIQIDRTMNVTDVLNNYRPLEKASATRPALTMEEIVGRNADRYELEASNIQSPPVYFARPGNSSPELAYLVSVKDKLQDSRPVQILFRASDGQVLSKSVARAEF